MDREGDIAALFCERQAHGGAELLVRARHDRVLSDGNKLFNAVRNSPSKGVFKVTVHRASVRRSARGQKAFAGRDARTAVCDLRWQEISFAVPQRERQR